jgi:MFS family permease
LVSERALPPGDRVGGSGGGIPSAGVSGGPPGPRLRPSLLKALAVFENRNYRYLWLSSTFSFTGMGMQQIARALLAWDLSHSFTAIGAISLSFGLPMLLLALVGGAIADRVDKRNLTLITQACIGSTGLLTAILIVTGAMTLEILFVIGLVQGTFFALGMPSRSPLMALVVGPQHLLSAMALSNASMNGTRLIGPAIAGVMAGTLGIGAVYFVQFGLYMLSVLCLLVVPSGLDRGMERRARANMVREIGHGLRYVSRDKRLRVLMLMGFILAFFGMPYMMLLAGFVQRDLGEGEWAVGTLMSLSGVGALVGSLAIATITEFPRKALVQFALGIGGGAMLISLALASTAFGLVGAMVTMVGLGLALNGYQTLNQAMVMEAAEPQYYGRVMSMNMLTFSSVSVMAAPLGVLADAFGADMLFIIQGVLIIVAMFAISLLNPGYIFGSTAGIVFPGFPGQGAPVRGGGAADPRSAGSAVPAAGDRARVP